MAAPIYKYLRKGLILLKSIIIILTVFIFFEPEL